MMVQPLIEAIQAWAAILANLPLPIIYLMELSVVMYFFSKIVTIIFHIRG